MTRHSHKWIKNQYAGALGKYDGGRWTITNGHIYFSVHLLIDGSIDKKRADANGFIVTPDDADSYAEQIVDALNSYGVDI